MKRRVLLQALAVLASVTAHADSVPVAHFNMELNGNTITETVTGNAYNVSSQLNPCTIAGLDGDALRFDGYSNFVRTQLATTSFGTDAFTLEVMLACESYPMMQVDVAQDTPTFATICGNLDEANKKGVALELSSQGDLRLRYGSATGFLMTVTGNKKLPRGEWVRLTAVMDKAANAATLYLNGESIGNGRMSRAAIAHSTTDFYIGRSAEEQKWGPFLINTFCGAIDDIAAYNTALTPTATAQTTLPDFSYPASRYDANAKASLWRPRFHGMPSGSWTNESHGMAYSNGRYHLFFQKNANGPYMSRLHWGHISSANLYDWREEPIAIAPGESYDLKGCWSGCVYEKNGTHYILYTAVDNAKARIAQARATDENLNHWEKLGVVIDGRPAGLSDDFRDPYFFTAGGNDYIIVGTSKNGIGACTLHRYQNGTWTNDGAIFFQGSNKTEHGTFWEMPNVTPLGNGTFLFTCTPLGTGVGVRTLCWVGTINADGTFAPTGNMQTLEMGGISRDGYGLLSPTILSRQGSAITLGIVPDKLPTETNFQMGWAHNFSLPRELTVDANGQLKQKPFAGLAGMRSATSFAQDTDLQGKLSLSPVAGRQMEIEAEFTLVSGTCGFNFLQSGSQQASLTYDSDRGTLTLDLTALNRTVNDAAPYAGIYTTSLPQRLQAGEKLKLHLFLDGSIADIFVNDTWAYSVRLFPNDAAATTAEVFATAQMNCNVKAWVLDPSLNNLTGIEAVKAGTTAGKQESHAAFDLTGKQLNTSALQHRGIYIQGGKKHLSTGK